MSASACVPGLAAALEEVGLNSHIEEAGKWCEEMGPKDLQQVAEEFEDFSSDLKLRPLEKKRLLKLLKGESFKSESQSPSPTERQQWDATTTVLVKNTFLTDMPADVQLRRLQTEPVRQGGGDLDSDAEDIALQELLNSEKDEEADSPEQHHEEENYEEEEAPPAASPELRPTMSLYKTVTLDGYEPINEWGWADGDYNGGHQGAAGPAHLEAYPEEEAEQTGPSPAAAGEGEAASSSIPQPQQPNLVPHMVGYVMVPTEVNPGFAIPQFPAAMTFPGCVAVPMDRFTQWPVDMNWQGNQGQVGPDQAAGSTGAQGSMGGQRGGPMPPEMSGLDGEGSRRPQVLQSAFSVASCIYRVRWTVDARKLVSTDREHVSPAFDLSFAGPVKFKMLMRPKVMSDEKGGQSFKKARGRGKVLLRCVEDLDSNAAKPVVTFRIAVGNPHKQAIPRGPVRHDFSEKPICGLPEEIQQWDFTKAVDKSTHTFVVCLEVLTSG
mmetsp:Transcript_28630/g.62291  ORF Transcript_28630/g.62291 Transcript_28630/m.62291 type:complete len:493 (+) Transcript_28630:156-1634(+)